MNYACLLLPTIIFCYVSRKISTTYVNRIKLFKSILYDYLIGNIIINSLVIGLLLIKGYDGIIIDSLNNNTIFSIKYIVSSSFIALLLPFLLKKTRNNLNTETIANIDNKKLRNIEIVKSSAIIIFTVLMGSLHLIRCFNNSFWLDEGNTIIIARERFWDMLNLLALVFGHAPFQYAVECLFWHTFGESGFIFHFASTLPYFIVLVVSVTIVRKLFGNIASIILTTLCSLLDCAIIYNLEVRMYAWCELFILLAFLMDYCVYLTNKGKYYFLMSLFSIGAVYSHYFALASIGIIYLFLFLYKIIYRKFFDVIKVIISGGSVLIILLPWIIYVKIKRGVVIPDWGFPVLSWRQCFSFIFYSDYSKFLFIFFIITSLLVFFYDLGFIKKTSNRFRINLQYPHITKQIADKWIWELSGVCGVLGTIVFSQIYSMLVFPITTYRFLYLCFVIIWLLFSINISNMKSNKIIALILVVFIISTNMPKYYATVVQEINIDHRLRKVLSSTEEIDENDIIYTNMMDIFWTVSRIYYPRTQCVAFENPKYNTPDMPIICENRQGWLFIQYPITTDLQDYLQSLGKKARLVDNGILIIDNGLFGMENVFIYKIINLDK